MTCLVKLTQKIITQNGGNDALSLIVMTTDEYEKIKESLPEKHYVSFKVDLDDAETHKIFDRHKRFQRSLISEITNMKPEERFKIMLNLNKYRDADGDTIANMFAYRQTHVFTINEILLLGNGINESGETLALILLERGYHFSVDDIIKIGNPSDEEGETLAHTMIYRSVFKPFSADEIIKLGNPVNTDGYSLVDLMELNDFNVSDEDKKRIFESCPME